LSATSLLTVLPSVNNAKQHALFEDLQDKWTLSLKETKTCNPVLLKAPSSSSTSLERKRDIFVFVILKGVQSYYVMCEKEAWKLDTLCDLYDCVSISQSVVCVNSDTKANFVLDKLIQREFSVSALVKYIIAKC
jgi:superfamily II DNA/RNA helicase